MLDAIISDFHQLWQSRSAELTPPTCQKGNAVVYLTLRNAKLELAE